MAVLGRGEPAADDVRAAGALHAVRDQLPRRPGVYWITTNLWTMGQQWVVKQVIPPPPKPTEEEEKAAKPPPPPPRKQRNAAAEIGEYARNRLARCRQLRDRRPDEPASRVARSSSGSSTSSTSTPRSRSTRATRRSSAGSTARTSGLLIGRRGQTIDAVQLLCYRAAFRGAPGSQAGRRSTPPATASAGARRSSARPIAPPSGRSRPARRSSSSR